MKTQGIPSQLRNSIPRNYKGTESFLWTAKGLPCLCVGGHRVMAFKRRVTRQDGQRVGYWVFKVFNAATGNSVAKFRDCREVRAFFGDES